MRILFICFSTLQFNVETPLKEPLGGTESALCYLSVELAKKHQVYLMRKADEQTKDGEIIKGVTHLYISENIDVINPDVVVVVSAPQAVPGVRKIVPKAKIIFWCHMMPDQPAMAHAFNLEVQKEIDHTIYVSENQRNAFVAVAGNAKSNLVFDGPKTSIIGNAISPAFENMFVSAEEIYLTKQCKAAYTSTPFRGLAVLSHVKEIIIEVYSSMKVYQNEDTVFETLFSKLKENECLRLKGSVSQTELRDALKSISFLTYPCIFAECHSIAILEAMAAGLKIITTDRGCQGSQFVDSMPLDKGSLEEYAARIRKNVNYFRSQPEKWAIERWEQIQYINKNCIWSKRADEWDKKLNKICQNQAHT